MPRAEKKASQKEAFFRCSSMNHEKVGCGLRIVGYGDSRRVGGIGFARNNPSRSKPRAPMIPIEENCTKCETSWMKAIDEGQPCQP